MTRTVFIIRTSYTQTRTYRRNVLHTFTRYRFRFYFQEYRLPTVPRANIAVSIKTGKTFYQCTHLLL